MTSFHKSVSTAKKDQEEKKNTAVAKLERWSGVGHGSQWTISRNLSGSCIAATAEAEVVGHEVNRFDIDLVTVDGIVHQRVAARIPTSVRPVRCR